MKLIINNQPRGGGEGREDKTAQYVFTLCSIAWSLDKMMRVACLTVLRKPEPPYFYARTHYILNMIYVH